MQHLDCCTSSTCVLITMQGFDEFMNLVMDDAEEVYVKEKKRRQVGEFTLISM